MAEQTERFKLNPFSGESPAFYLKGARMAGTLKATLFQVTQIEYGVLCGAATLSGNAERVSKHGLPSLYGSNWAFGHLVVKKVAYASLSSQLWLFSDGKPCGLEYSNIGISVKDGHVEVRLNIPAKSIDEIVLMTLNSRGLILPDDMPTWSLIGYKPLGPGPSLNSIVYPFLDPPITQRIVFEKPAEFQPQEQLAVAPEEAYKGRLSHPGIKIDNPEVIAEILGILPDSFIQNFGRRHPEFFAIDGATTLRQLEAYISQMKPGHFTNTHNRKRIGAALQRLLEFDQGVS